MRREYLKIFIFIACLMIPITPLNAKTSPKVKKMHVYNRVIKAGNSIYCSNGYVLYKVNKKRGTAKTLYAYHTWTGDYFLNQMRLKGKYLYFVLGGENVSSLYRINVKTGKRQRLMKENGFLYDYVISGRKIYYRRMIWSGTEPTIRRVMKCNGKSVKKTRIRAKSIRKDTNKAGKGYKVIEKRSGSRLVKYWLKYPNGKKVYLGKLN